MTIISEKLEALRNAFKIGDISKWEITHIWHILVALIEAAEAIFQGAGRGVEKHEAVKIIWSEIEQKYDLYQKLDDVIKLPFWLEPFDKKLFPVIIDLVISLIVQVYNKAGIFQK